MDRTWRLRLLLLGGIALLLHASSGVRPPAPSERPALAAHRPTRAAPVPQTVPVRATAAGLLAGRTLAMPVQGMRPAQLHDNFSDGRSRGRKHRALDIMAPRGTPVLAADDGTVAKISSNKGGGLAEIGRAHV